jgi:hypothetical protein
MPDSAVASLPATDWNSIRAADLLRTNGFHRTMHGAVQLWQRASGAFHVRVAITPAAVARLSLAVRQKDGGHYGEHQPWSIDISPVPTAVAWEAVWFVAVVEGLPAPHSRGYHERTRKRHKASVDLQEAQ